MAEYNTPFKDAIVSKEGFNIKPTMPNPGQPQDGAQSGVSGSVTPKELPSNTLKFGSKD